MGKHKGIPNYTDEEKAEIIAHVLVNVACGRPVDRIFREDDTTEGGVIPMPAQSTFWLWLFADETNELSEKLARAREYGIEALIDRAIATAETPMVGESHTIERIKPADMDLDDMLDHGPEDRVKTVIGDMTAHRKLYIETMFKAAQMLKPKKYGPKLDLMSGGKSLGLREELKEARQREIDMLQRKADK
jgi:uncharacterized protein YbjQ (UPF0145 family)